MATKKPTPRREVVYAYTTKKTKAWLNRKYKKSKHEGSFSAWFDAWVQEQIVLDKAQNA